MDERQCREHIFGPAWFFHRLVRAHHNAQGAVFDRLGLRDLGQPILLMLLNDNRAKEQRLTQRELADRLHISPSTMTVSVKSLLKRGLITKVQDGNDLRRNFIEITDDGVAIAETCHKAFQHIDSVMYAGFSPDEIEAVTGYFNRIYKNLGTLEQKSDQFTAPELSGAITDNSEKEVISL